MRQKPGGFATISAVALIGLVGATLAALAVAFSTDAKRSTRQNDDAQLRQLLIAGEMAVRTSLESGGTADGKVDLPAELAVAGLSVRYEKAGEDQPNSAHIRVMARMSEKHSANQIVSFHRNGNRWELQSAELD
jgi:hypothetical protein